MSYMVTITQKKSSLCTFRAPTDLENMEKSGRKIVVRVKSGNFVFFLKVGDFFFLKADCHKHVLLILSIIDNV